MNPVFEKQTGFCLILFTILIFLTMILHPAGGSLPHMVKITTMIVISHSIAILSLPFGAIGFWGLSRKLGPENILTATAFAFSILALVAALLAGTTNGLILPLFVLHYKDATTEMIESLKPILTYGHAVNTAFDYIYTGAFSIAIAAWSVSALKTGKLPRRLAVWGLVVAVSGVALAIFAASPATLYGLYLFAAGLISWTIFAGMTLIRKPQ
jgi:hypothetical protein